MDLTLSRKLLLDLLGRAVPIADAKSPMLILSNVLLAADAGGTLTVSATDLMVSYTGSRPATVRKPGSMCVPAALFRAIVSKLPDGDITITEDKWRAALKSKGVRRADSLVAMPGDDWPTMPANPGGGYTMPAAALADVRRLTSYAQSDDSARPHLAATLLMLHGDTLRAVATNGQRLSIAERSVVGMRAANVPGTGKPMSLLVPSAALVRLGLPDTGQITVSSASGTGPLFLTDGTTGDEWSTKLVNADFPSWEQVVPSSFSASITCNRAALIDSLSAVATVAIESTGGVRLSVVDGSLKLSTKNPDAGEMTDTIDAVVTGDVHEWGMSATFLGDVLRALKGERVTFEVTGELDPVTMRCPTEGAQFAGIIMPVRIQ